MNCQEVQLQLSGYLEKSLDTIRMKSIESHLSSCPFCRAELHGLSDCIQLVSALPVVDPPPGFTQRVMAHAHELEPEPRSWQRLFAAFKVTVPVQAAAVILVSVLAVLLYQKQPQVNNFALPDRSPAAPLSQGAQTNKLPAEDAPGKSLEDAEISGSNKRDGSAAVEPAPRPAAKARQQSTADSVAAKDEAATAQSEPAAESEKVVEKGLERRIPVVRRPTIQAQEVSTASEAPRASADALGIGAAIGALSRSPFRASPFSAERALSPLSEPSPDFEFVVKRRASARAVSTEPLRNRSEATTDAPGARERSVASSAPVTNQVVEIRWFTVAPEHYGQFRKDLAAEAIIDSEKSSAAKERDFGLKPPRELLIKVTILPADG